MGVCFSTEVWLDESRCTLRDLYNAQQDSGIESIVVADKDTRVPVPDLAITQGSIRDELPRAISRCVYVLRAAGIKRPIHIFVSPQSRNTVCLLVKGALRKKHVQHRVLAISIKVVTGGWQAYAEAYPFMVKGGRNHAEGRLYPSEVDQALYISNISLATCEECIFNLGITHIINATEVPVCPFEGPIVTYMRVPVTDDVDEIISDYFPTTTAFIDSNLHRGGRVLVHSQHGKSRSATIIAAYLMSLSPSPDPNEYTGLSQPKNIDDIIAQLKAVNSLVSPNHGFLKQLRKSTFT